MKIGSLVVVMEGSGWFVRVEMACLAVRMMRREVSWVVPAGIRVAR